MHLVPHLVQQGMTLTQFLVLTLKTNPLGMIAIFTMSNISIKEWLRKKTKSIKGQLELTFYSLAITLLTGPFIIDWMTHTYHYVNGKLGEFTDDFFTYTSSIGM